MKKKTTLSEEDQALFRQLMAGTRKIKQDTIVHRPQRKKISEVPVKRLIQEQADASHYFSDELQLIYCFINENFIHVFLQGMIAIISAASLP